MDEKMRVYLKQIFLFVHKQLLKLGIILIPNHYYSNVPDINKLREDKDQWCLKSDMPGVSAPLENQVRNLKTICLSYQDEFHDVGLYEVARSRGLGPGYGEIETQALYALIRHYEPENVIEVGSGLSTAIIEKSLSTGKRGHYKHINVEPNPNEALKSFVAKRDRAELIESKVQSCSQDLFHRLTEDDLLYIDSSHAVKPGSDVNFLILEVLPRLQPGVVVHFHDIYFPYDYSPRTLQTFFHWNETSLLRAFLIDNENWDVLFSMSHLHYDKPDDLKEVFPEYNPRPDRKGLVDHYLKPFTWTESQHFPCSTFLRKR